VVALSSKVLAVCTRSTQAILADALLYESLSHHEVTKDTKVSDHVSDKTLLKLRDLRAVTFVVKIVFYSWLPLSRAMFSGIAWRSNRALLEALLQLRQSCNR